VILLKTTKNKALKGGASIVMYAVAGDKGWDGAWTKRPVYSNLFNSLAETVAKSPKLPCGSPCHVYQQITEITGGQ